MTDFLPPERILGESPGLIELDDGDGHRDVTTCMVDQARRLLDLAARRLDPAIYDTEPFLAAVKKLALRSRYSRIRLLVLEPEGFTARGHRLIGLCRQLSSYIEMRRPGDLDRDFNEAMLMVDEQAYVHRPVADRYEATASFYDPPRTRDLVRRFDALWERGEVDADFRRLHL